MAPNSSRPRSALADFTRHQRRQARKAGAELCEAARAAGCPLPSVGVDSPSAITGDVLVSLGCARPDVITRLAQVIRAGAIALAAEGAKDTGTHLWTPRVGDLVVDTEADRVGEFRGGSGGRWTLARSTGGDEWTADPRHVRAPGANERVRVGMAEAVGGSDKGVG